MQISIQKSKGQTFVQFKLADVISVFALMLISFVTIDTLQAQGFSQDQRRVIIQSLSDEERQKFFGMSWEDKQKFFQERAKKSGGSGGQSAIRPGGGPGGPEGRRRGRPPTLVELGDVIREPLVQTFLITGRLVASQKVILPRASKAVFGKFWSKSETVSKPVRS